MPSYLISARQRKGTEFVAEPGPIRYIRIPDGATHYDASHVISATTWVSEVRGLADGDLNPQSISPYGDVLVFVHGYNNDISAAIGRTNDLAANLAAQGWRGVVVGFDWPSDKTVLNYAEDRMDAAEVARHLVGSCIRILVEGQQAKCETNVHLIGHSTGAYVILEAFAQAEKKGDFFKADWRLGQVALIAGDISADSLRAAAEWSQPMFRRIMRLTNYANGSDAVLAVSNAKRLGVSPRAGRIGLPADAPHKAVNVDCTAYFHGLMPPAGAGMAFCHGWHFTDPRFGLDLALTLEGAMDREAIPTRDRGARGLVLNATGERPKGMAGWGIKEAAQKMAQG